MDNKSEYRGDLWIIRGVPGCGKSTVAQQIGGIVLEADDYFMEDGVYRFDPEKLGAAHLQCQAKADGAMEAGAPRVVVSNTSTHNRDVTTYTKLAEKHGYRVFTIVVENRHGGVDVHGVPEEHIEKMDRNLRSSIKLSALGGQTLFDKMISAAGGDYKIVDSWWNQFGAGLFKEYARQKNPSLGMDAQSPMRSRFDKFTSVLGDLRKYAGFRYKNGDALVTVRDVERGALDADFRIVLSDGNSIMYSDMEEYFDSLSQEDYVKALMEDMSEEITVGSTYRWTGTEREGTECVVFGFYIDTIDGNRAWVLFTDGTRVAYEHFHTHLEFHSVIIVIDTAPDHYSTR